MTVKQFLAALQRHGIDGFGGLCWYWQDEFRNSHSLGGMLTTNKRLLLSHILSSKEAHENGNSWFTFSAKDGTVRHCLDSCCQKLLDSRTAVTRG